MNDLKRHQIDALNEEIKALETELVAVAMKIAERIQHRDKLLAEVKPTNTPRWK